MTSEQTDPAGLRGREDHRRRPSSPPAGPLAEETLVNQIVRAVRSGDDPALRDLLAQLTRIADLALLLHLRRRLYENTGAL
ncbi:hypothetical protein [Streptomyces spororaveus]|uniref:hypothetical protein n=1 Tax=Streptomyces spororaveus TaxID=284039 RepID=UPI0037B6E4B7